ncbi:MAG: PIG-L family deacetylase [Lapillicoccus sp.]
MTASNGHRLGVVDEAGRGTPAWAWRGWADQAPDLGLSGWRDVVVVAPHPDDEVLGVGGLIRRLVRDGVRVRVVAVTDGEGAPAPRGWSPERLATERVIEAVAACGALGVDPPHRLGLPDGRVGEHEAALTEALSRLLSPSTHCLATWRSDGYPDHEATGRAAAAACAQTSAALVEYPVWMWHWAAPDDPAVPWERVHRVALTPQEREAKAVAVARHGTQLDPPAPGVDPVLPPFVVERLVTSYEMVMR